MNPVSRYTGISETTQTLSHALFRSLTLKTESVTAVDSRAIYLI